MLFSHECRDFEESRKLMMMIVVVGSGDGDDCDETIVVGSRSGLGLFAEMESIQL